MSIILISALTHRKEILERELFYINELLSMQAPDSKVDGSITVISAQKLGLISVRASNVILNELSPSGDIGKTITLSQMVTAVINDEARFMRAPNFGRKILSEIKLLAYRIV